MLLLLPLQALAPPGLLRADLGGGQHEAGGLDGVEEDPADQVGVGAVVHLEAQPEPGRGWIKLILQQL